MAALIELLAMLRVPAGVVTFLMLVRFAPFVVDRTRATVRGLEGLLTDCASLMRTARRVMRSRKRQKK